MAENLPPDHSSSQPLVAAPRLIELCFQTAGLWEMLAEHRMGLPQHMDAVSVYRAPEPANGTRLYAEVTARPGSQGAPGTFDAAVVDSAGNRYVELRGYRTVALPDPIDLEPLGVVVPAVA
jgi:hypothetical protein